MRPIAQLKEQHMCCRFEKPRRLTVLPPVGSGFCATAVSARCQLIDSCKLVADEWNLLSMEVAASSDPSQVNRGVRSRIDAINSMTPEPMRPHGSAWTFVKM